MSRVPRSVNRAVRLTRWSEWGGFKQGPLLAVAYLAVWHSSNNALAPAAIVVGVLAGLCWAYLLNAVADRDDDSATGKLKPFAQANSRTRVMVLGLIAVLAMAGAWLAGDVWSLVGIGGVLMAGLVYSYGPRLRNRTVAGTLTAALGQRTAPLLAFTGLLGIPWPAYAALHVVFLGSGLRGILIHQFVDRSADMATGHRTVATALSEGTLRRLLTGIAGAELVGTTVAGRWLLPVAIALALYLLAGLLGSGVWRQWTWNQRAFDYSAAPLNHLYFLFLPITAAVFAWTELAFGRGPFWARSAMTVVLATEAWGRRSQVRGVLAVMADSLHLRKSAQPPGGQGGSWSSRSPQSEVTRSTTTTTTTTSSLGHRLRDSYPVRVGVPAMPPEPTGPETTRRL